MLKFLIFFLIELESPHYDPIHPKVNHNKVAMAIKV